MLALFPGKVMKFFIEKILLVAYNETKSGFHGIISGFYRKICNYFQKHRTRKLHYYIERDEL